MNRPIVTLTVVEEAHLHAYATAMTATWTHAWLRLSTTNEIVLAEIYRGGGWCYASSDVLDETLFNGIRAVTPDFYGGKSFAHYQASVLAPLCTPLPDATVPAPPGGTSGHPAGIATP